MATSTSLKVPKDKLIERIREARTEAEAVFNANARDAQAKYDKWETEALKSLEKLATRIKAGKVNLDDETWEDYNGGKRVSVIEAHGSTAPRKPSPEKFNGDQFDSDIRLLELAEADSVTVTTNNQWSRYL